jgi:hypothetical protein
MIKTKKSVTLCLVGVLLLSTVGCDPEKVVSEYFRKAGLTRLAGIRTDVEPGGLVIVGKEGAIYADNMLDYLETSPETEYPIVGGDGKQEIDAILKKFTSEKSMGAELAVKFLQGVFPAPIGLEAKLGLTNSVKIDLINAKLRRMKIPTVNKFLSTSDSLPFRKAVLESMASKQKAYLIYETWRSNKLKITSEQEKDVSTSIDVGQVKEILGEGKLKFYVKRLSKSELEISGEQYYVFAVRTGELLPIAGSERLKFDITGFVRSTDSGIKSGGEEDDKFTAPIDANNVVVPLLPRRPY